MGEEVLGWLLGEACHEELGQVRRLITALRLLRDDARRGVARVEPSWCVARDELERVNRRRTRRALDALLYAYLDSLKGPDSFLSLGPEPMKPRAAWSQLLGGSSPFDEDLLPAPGEAPAALFRRLLSAGERNGAPLWWRMGWEAARRHLTEGARDSERSWGALLTRAAEAGAPAPLLARFLGGKLAARLERYQPRRGWDLFRAHGHLVGADARLRRLFGWSALLCGELARARELLRGVQPTRLPRPLAALRTDSAECADLLPETAGSEGQARDERGGQRAVSRGTFGALLLGAFRFRTGGPPEVLHLDAPRRLAGEIRRRLAALPPPGVGAARRACEFERRLTEKPLEWALSGAGARAVARVLLEDENGTARGWLQVESEHLLLPPAPVLVDLAREWRRSLTSSDDRVREERALCSEVRASETWEGPRALPYGSEDPRREFLRRLLDGRFLRGRPGIRWLERKGETLLVRAERGVPAPLRAAASALVRRAFEPRTREEPGAAGSRAVESGAGVVVPLMDSGSARVLGVLWIDARRDELPAAFLEALSSRLRSLEPLWWAATFRASARSSGNPDVALTPGSRFWERTLSVLSETALADRGLLLVGEKGSGRRTLVRWLAFRAAFAGRGRGGPAAPRVFEVEQLSKAAQLTLAASPEAPGRLFLLARRNASVLVQRRILLPELAQVLEPQALVVPSLSHRRDEIPEMIRVIAADLSRREGLRSAPFEDEAVAALWRQDWRDHVAELTLVLARLVRTNPGKALTARCVQEARSDLGLDFRRRLPSGSPRQADMEFALACTRHGSGNPNRSRAARYLGWDPGTLAARLRGLRLGTPSGT